RILPEAVGTGARPDLALEVVHAVSPIRAINTDRRRSVLHGQARNQWDAHLPCDVIIRVVGAAEDLAFTEVMPADAELVDQRGAKGVGFGDGDTLGASEIITLVVAPEGDAGLVRVVEEIASGDHVVAGKVVIDARSVVALMGDGAEGIRKIVEGSVDRVGL